MKNFNDDYYAGFDIGTDSVGYAVADTDYNLCKFKGNAMWGVDLFEESNSAAERRTLRSARRRGLRKRNRIEWLQMLFDQEISKVDNAFYQRLKKVVCILMTNHQMFRMRFLQTVITPIKNSIQTTLQYIILEKNWLRAHNHTM